MKKELMIITEYPAENLLSFDEICNICEISHHFVYDLIEYDIIRPEGTTQDDWIFNLAHIQRIKIVQRLQHDLEVNLAGVALILELLEEIERLRAKAELLDKYIL